jgi:hypothetical protein
MMGKLVSMLLLTLCFVIDLDAQFVLRGPYLQSSSETEVTVRWRTHPLSTSRVTYGTSVADQSLSVSDTINKINHEIRITGLNPGTVYYYSIGTTTSVLVPADGGQYFKTHPAEGSTDPYKFWILGDCGTANDDQRDVRDAYYNYIGTDHTDGMIFLGDNAYHTGLDSEYQYALFQYMYEDKLKNTVAWATLGNHDGVTASSASQTGPYYDIFTFPKCGESGGLSSGTEAYYSFDYGNIHFVCLESNETDRSVGGAMYNWCMNDIQNTIQTWIVAYWHHPPYSKGSRDSDTELQMIEMRQNFGPLLEDNGVDLVLSGHSHSYERSYFLNGHYGLSNSFDSILHTLGDNGYADGKIGQGGSYKKFSTGDDANDGAVYITAGSSGKISGSDFGHNAMYYSVAALGSCVLEVEGDRLDVKFIRENDTIVDYFTIEKEVEDCVPGTTCDDGNSCTIGDAFDSNCHCIGTQTLDSDGDGVCDTQDQCPGFNDALIGMCCDDNDNCTINDFWTIDCNCVGTPVGDDDGDGVCDTEDQCPGFHDGLIGTTCNDNSGICLPSICLSDFNQDGFVGGMDFAVFLGNFGIICGTCCPTDLNGSGITNGMDFAIFLGSVGLSCE